ncbi:MAG: adenylate/guanylate cyclase domain-containing protein [Casimicrobiaceae bacterium]
MRAIRALRLATGLVLALYVTVHFSNHALGIFSVDAQEAMRKVVSPVWRSLPGTVLLYFALIVHPVLGLYALWRRQTLRMPTWELMQLALGLAVPLMLIPHVFGTRVAASMLGTESTYPNVIGRLWSSPETLIRQSLLVLIVWMHVAVGMHFWLRLRAGYRRWLPVTYVIAAMVPLLALLGFWGAGFELRKAQAANPVDTRAAFAIDDPERDAARADPPYDAMLGKGGGGPPTALQSRLEGRKELALWTAASLFAFVLLARAARRRLQVRKGTYRIQHASGLTVVAPLGQSLLDALREAGVPHASVCGGRARCTTCRVRLGPGYASLPAPNAAEMLALQRIHAEPNVRLACQLRPDRDVGVTPLLPADAGAADANGAGKDGRERAVAVMFVDLRDSSRFAEHRLPYDVLFILNRFFAEMAAAVNATGGYYSTFHGDGFMALYGTASDIGAGCRDALHGTVAVADRLAGINAALASELREPLRVGISVHAGEAIVGTMGPPAHPIVSALGDTVNVASRLEGEAKRHGCALVVSATCARAAGVDLSEFPEHTVNVRGRAQSVSYYVIADAAMLEPLLPARGAAQGAASWSGTGRKADRS